MCRRVESERIVPVCLPGSEKKNTWTVVAGFGRSERDKFAESDGRLRQVSAVCPFNRLRKVCAVCPFNRLRQVAAVCPFNRRQDLAAQRGTSTQSQTAGSGKCPHAVPLTDGRLKQVSAVCPFNRW